MTLNIGRGTTEDIEELVELRLGYLTDDFGELACDAKQSVERELPSYLERHIDNDLLVFVARECGCSNDTPISGVPDSDTPSSTAPSSIVLGSVTSGDNSRIVSCAWLLMVEKPPSPRFPHGRTGTLFNVYTLPNRRRQGIARQVMQSLIATAKEMCLDVIELSATDDGYPLYRSLGFDDDSSTHTAMRMVLFGSRSDGLLC